MVQKFSDRERVYLATTLLRTEYDFLHDLFAKRRIMEELQTELRQHFRGNHSITQIQRRWSDMKRRERRFLRQVRQEHVPDAQMPVRQHRGIQNAPSEEPGDQPPPLDVGEGAGPFQQPPNDAGPPALEAEAPEAPEGADVGQQPAPARPHHQRANRRSQLAAISRQLAALASSMQEALGNSDSSD